MATAVRSPVKNELWSHLAGEIVFDVYTPVVMGAPESNGAPEKRAAALHSLNKHKEEHTQEIWRCL